MKLLFDQNLSHRLCNRLADLGVTLVHVRTEGLEAADDARVWDHAAEHDLTIVNKDADFNNRAFLYGPPPKVVWIRRGNCSNEKSRISCECVMQMSSRSVRIPRRLC